MSDWRTNPRQGRSQFLPLLDEIKKSIENGETIKMIFESYPELKMSYPQFTRYIKKYCGDETKVSTQKADNGAAVQQSDSQDVSTAKPARTARNPADLRKLRKQNIDLEELRELGEKNESGNS